MDTPPPQTQHAAALAWVEHWYATPDDQLPEDWAALEALLQAHPFDLGEKDQEEDVC